MYAHAGVQNLSDISDIIWLSAELNFSSNGFKNDITLTCKSGNSLCGKNPTMPNYDHTKDNAGGEV